MVAILEKLKEIALGVLLVVLFIFILCLLWAIIKATYLKIARHEPFFANVKEIFWDGTLEVILEAIMPWNWL